MPPSNRLWRPDLTARGPICHDARVTTTLRAKPDAATVAAVDAARDALIADVGFDDVGDHLAHVVEGERLVTHLVVCTRRG